METPGSESCGTLQMKVPQETVGVTCRGQFHHHWAVPQQEV
ncbi:hypothetical protein D4764_12G0011410 [Takifugu flavidus]|uniref:Uncharacterized protein n=1 Tax=Takifugu flavidus TaxID=433684 RepID=A0A5C6PG40_9TELE|nr:hypothetical protein D4764_12G0011410 [Takifugu flavidus]